METRNTNNSSEEISLVQMCAATECKHNEHKHCTAGQITLIIADGKPECGTFDPEPEHA